jgi:hypothetical protein
MKFVLILHVCSFITMQCPGSAIMGEEFSSWSDCAKAGYYYSSRQMSKYDEKQVNTNKIAIKFECKEVGPTT